jgi:D-alanyl-D-alanine carboxypeptidase
MPLAFLRWGVLLLICFIASTAFAGEGKVSRLKAKGAKFVRLKNGELLHHAAAAAFQRMSTEARVAGVSLRVTSGYRSRRQQHWLYERFRKGLGPKAARPGRSNHQRGLALDLVVGNVTTPTYDWLASHACRFGFRRTVQSEPWHWEYRPRTTRVPKEGQDCLGRDVGVEPAPVPVATKDAS